MPPAARIGQIHDYRTAAVTIASVVDRDLGFGSFPVTFRFYPGRAAFEAALLGAGYDRTLAQRTARTMVAVGGHRGVLVNSDALEALEWPERVGLLAHEVGHSLQYELGGGKRGTSDQWLREGFADWLSVRVLEKLQNGSAGAILRQRRRALPAPGRSTAPALGELVTFPQWVQAGERHGAAMYALSFFAVDFLLKRHGLEAFVGYFKRFATSDDRVANFREAFGEDLESFERALDDSLRRR